MIKSEWPMALAARYHGLFIWLPLILVSLFVGGNLWYAFAQHMEQAENRALTLARAVEQHATATMDRSNLALLAVIQHLRPGDLDRRTLGAARQRELTDLLVRQHQEVRGVVSMSITDAEGIVLVNSVGVPPGADLGQRRYFQQLKAGPTDGFVISEAIKGRVSNKWGMQVARRINRPDGSFGGMVVANLGLYENFESFYETLDIGSRGVIALTQDNTVLVRYPVIESALGTSVSGSGGTQAVSEKVAEKVVRSVSPIDHVDRIATVRKSPYYPIYTVVGIAGKDVLLSWLRDSATLLVMSSLVLPLFALISIMVQHRFKMLQELRDAEHALAEEREARQTLLEQEVATRTADLQLANRKLESFLYAASHDLKGPLGRISSFSTLLEKNYRDRLQGDGLQFLDFIRENALRLTLLIDDLLAHARIDQELCQVQPIDIGAAVEAMVNKKADDLREAGAVVRMDVPPGRVLADAIGLTQVLGNLLENAIKYSADSAAPVIEIGGQEVEGHFRLWIRDNGIGFDMKYHDRIFEIFRRLHTYAEYPGTGVGLALVKRAVERMGGKVWAESATGAGATFFLELPAAP